MRNKSMEKILCLFMAMIVFLNNFMMFAYATDSIYSKASDWSKAEIQSAYDNGLIPSILKGKDMTNAATREELCELAVILYEKLSGELITLPTTNQFKDTKNPQILKAYSIGITNGTTNVTFDPDAITNREQVAAMFGRSIQKLYPNMDYSGVGAPNFEDKEYISSWAISHVLFMSKEGVLKGSNGKFMPKAVTADQTKTGYGTTTREQAIAITVRIFSKYQVSGAITGEAMKDMEKAAISFIDKSIRVTKEIDKFNEIDFNKRIFRPVYKPNLTISAEDNNVPGLPQTFTNKPYSVLIRKDLSKKHSFKWSLPNDVLAQTSKIIWQVSMFPFDGKPVKSNSVNPNGMLFSGTIQKSSNIFTIDFEKVEQAEKVLSNNHVLLNNNLSLNSTLIAPISVKPIPIKPIIIKPILKDPGLINNWSISNILLAGKGDTNSQKIYYVRAYPVNSAGDSIGDTGSGMTILYGSPVVANNPYKPVVMMPFSLLPADSVGEATYGKEFNNSFIDRSECSITPNNKKTYYFLPTGFSEKTQELIVQVSLTPFDSALNDAWQNVSGLVYENRILSNNPIFTDIKQTHPKGIPVDFTNIVPSASQISDKSIPYYVRVTALTEGQEMGSVDANYSETITINYGEIKNDIKIYPVIKIDPLIPKISSINYTPVNWENCNWMYHYVVIKQPTIGDVFGQSYPVNKNQPYTQYSVGTKLDFTPQPPEEKSWWEKAWNSITDFFADTFRFAADVANWVSKAYDSIKTGIIKFAMKAFPLPSPFDEYMEQALTGLANYGLMAIGLPPTLPNFDDLADMGVDYLAKMALEQANIPASELAIDATEKLAGELSDQMKSSSKNSTPNPMNWDFIKYDPDYLYKPAYIMIDLYNDTGKVTPKGNLNCIVDTFMDSSKNGSDQTITHLYAVTMGSSYIMLFKPVVGMKIPSMEPGEHLTIPIFLEEFVNVPLYNNGPSLKIDELRAMYYELGKYNYGISIQYDLPPIDEALKEQGYTEDAIYSYSSLGSSINFSIEPYKSYSK